MTRRAQLLTGLLLATLPAAAWAHSGHDHAEPPPLAAATADSRSSYAVSERLEILARWPARRAEEPVPFRFLLSDFMTNAPIAGAEISLSFTGPVEAEGVAIATATPGIYQAEVALPTDGEYELIATVAVDEGIDLLVLDHLDVGPDEAPVESGAFEERGGSSLLVWGLLAALLAGGTVLWLRRAGRQTSSTSALPAALLAPGLIAGLLTAPSLAQAHADHDDVPSAQSSWSAPGAPLYLAKESQFLLGIRTVVVEERAVSDRVRTQGRLVAPPNRQAPLFTPQTGRLLAVGGVFPTLGSRIRKGDVLGVVDATLSAGERASFAAEAANARGGSRRGEAQLEAAQLKLARLESLEGIVARQEIEVAQVEVRSAEADLAAARGAERAFDGSLGTGKLKLVSPIDGILADIGATPGEMVDPSRQIFLVVDPQELWVEANLFEADLAAVERAQEAVATVEAYPREAFKGALLGAAQVVNPSTRTLKAVFSLPNPDSRLKVGMFAEIAIAAGAERTSLAIPESAVTEIDGRRVVYVREGPEVFSQREIMTGARDGAWVEVVAGLTAGERVVVSGTYSVRNAPQAVR